MKYVLIRLWLFLAVLLPLATTQAELTGEVIFVHPENGDNELWQTDTWDTRNAHRIFKHTQGIDKLAVQKGGAYIVFVAITSGKKRGFDAYLIDRTRRHAKARNLTWQRYDSIWDVDISHKGDVIFRNAPSGRKPEPPYGIYLIPREELENEFPNPTLLIRRDSALRVTWAPDGIHIAYDVAGGGIYVYNTVRRGASKGVTSHGYFPVFSPDGNRLALVHKVLGEGAAISIISLAQPRRRLKTIALEDHSSFSDLKWSPDGQSLVYTVSIQGSYHTYAVSVDRGGEHEDIWEIEGTGVSLFDWTNTTYAVDPTKKLTTLWGKLKTQN